jgi:hypothetical protein
MEHLELPVAGFDDISFRHEPCRLCGRAMIRFRIVAGEGNSVDHEFRQLNSGAAKRRDLLRAAFRKKEACRTGPCELVGLGRMYEDFAIGKLVVGTDVIDMRVGREHESRPRGQTIKNRPQRRHAHPAVDQNIALPSQDQETVRPDPPVAAGLRDPEEVR